MTVKIFGSEAEGASRWNIGKNAHAEGGLTTASGVNAHAEGFNTTASAAQSHAGGYQAIADAVGAWARSGVVLSNISATRANIASYSVAANTPQASAATLTFDGNASVNASVNGNVLLLPVNSCYFFNLYLVTRKQGSSTTSCQTWQYTGAVARDSGTARVLGTPTAVGGWYDSTNIGYLAWSVASNYLQITANNNGAGNLSWMGLLQTVELVAP